MKYTGGCHCGKVRFEAEMDLKNALQCNCSICIKKGSLLDFIPQTQFKLISGEDSLTDYLFNQKKIHHLFCKVCGVTAFAKAPAPDGTPTVAINIRCLDNVDLSALTISHYDGKSM